MKKIIISLLIIGGIGVGIYVIGLKKTSGPYFEALNQEKAGNDAQAVSLYISALIAITDSRPLPGKAQGMASSPEAWIKELDGYVNWLLAATAPPKRLQAVVDAINRVGKNSEPQNSISELSSSKAGIEEYGKRWNSIFYPEGKIPPPGQQALLEKARDASISILTMIGNSSYRYDGKVINHATGKCQDFTVYSNGQFSLPVRPGDYFLIVTSKATFPSGQVWISPTNVVPLTVSDSTLLCSLKLKTDIKRRS